MTIERHRRKLRNGEERIYTSLYLLGGIMTVAVGIIRIMIYSLPRQGGRLGH